MNDYLQELLNKREDGKEYKWLEDYKGECHKKHKIKHLVCENEYEVRPNDFRQGTRCPECAIKKKQKIYLQKLLDNAKDGKDYKWLEDYKGSNKIKHKIKHLVCGNEYEVRPNDFRQGNRCPFCFGKFIYKTSNLNYLQELLNKTKDGKDYKWLEEYKGNNKLKHKIKHLVCGNEYDVAANCFQQGNRCPFCANNYKIRNKTSNYKIRNFKKLIQEYLQSLLNKTKDGKDYQWLEEYKGDCHIKHKIKHLVCGNEYEVTPNHFQQKNRCPYCFGSNIYKNKKLDYLQSLLNEAKDGKDYKWLEEYKGKCHKKHKIKHLVCGNEYEVKPINFQQGKRCPFCANKNRNLSNIKKDYLISLLNDINDCEKEYEWQEEYKNNNKLKHKIKHLVCGTEYKVRPNDFQQGYRCPKCKNIISNTEVELLKYIKKLYKGKILSNNRSILNGKELDIYLPDLKLAFEFNGLYWHSEKGSKGRCDKDYHYNKMAECHNEGIRLIQIWENEWTDLKKKKIIKSKIKYLLNQIKPEKRIFARKCYIKEISKEKCNNFLNNNHIQGKSSNYLKTYGMFYKETKKLVAVMTFSKGLANRGSNDIELSRYTTKKFHNVIGGFSKMLSFAINENKWKEIYSYADLRLSDGNLYESNGWKKVSYAKPDYYYADVSKQLVFHKSLFKKSNIKSKFPEIYDEKLTEKEMMEKTKYLRIWDCGKIKYKYERE